MIMALFGQWLGVQDTGANYTVQKPAPLGQFACVCVCVRVCVCMTVCVCVYDSVCEGGGGWLMGADNSRGFLLQCLYIHASAPPPPLPLSPSPPPLPLSLS